MVHSWQEATILMRSWQEAIILVRRSPPPPRSNTPLKRHPPCVYDTQCYRVPAIFPIASTRASAM